MDLQTQVIKTQGSSSTWQTGPQHSRKMSRSELPTRRLSESLTSSWTILGNTAESAYHRIQEHVQRTVVDLGTLSNKLSIITTTSSETIQDLTYSNDMMLTLDDAELALNRTLICANVAVERLAQMKSESRERSGSRTSSVVYRRGGPGVDTVVVRRVYRVSESELQDRDPVKGARKRSTTVSEMRTESVSEKVADVRSGAGQIVQDSCESEPRPVNKVHDSEL